MTHYIGQPAPDAPPAEPAATATIDLVALRDETARALELAAQAYFALRGKLELLDQLIRQATATGPRTPPEATVREGEA